jgi:hypothetical protein
MNRDIFSPECVQLTVHSLPGGLLNHIAPTDNDDATAITTNTSTAIHYLDLGGIQACSLLSFGGSGEFWAGITKLYASNCGLQNIQGVSLLKNCRYLYLDNSKLIKEELLKLITELPTSLHHRLVSLDLSNNPGYDDQVEAAMLASPLFAIEEEGHTCYLNGKKIVRTATNFSILLREQA